MSATSDRNGPLTLRRILLVDDDAMFRDRLASALRKRGFEIAVADTPQTALDYTAEHAIDGAIVDLRMPGGSGLDLIPLLHARYPWARLVVLTGYGSIATALQAVRAGAIDYVTKPADADQILAALRGESQESSGQISAESIEEPIPSLDRVEGEYMHKILTECGGNVSQPARLLGLDRRTLQRKLNRYPPVR